ncbi:CE1759 family FMN reductase [Timonella sp. A28]|uniref:CE1759 family FMN reductase n=1 Tax=Timonella sp. A28 TaxID=3442640 RepID=UPI003EC0346F
MSTIVALSAGLSKPSSTRILVDAMATATKQELAFTSHVDATVTVIELRDYAHDIVDNLLTGFASPRLEQLKNDVVASDGLIAATPIFSQSFSGLFKSFLDVLDQKSLINKPVFLGATGGTARHSLALEYAVRPVFAYFRAAVSPTAIFAASEDWGAAEGVSSNLEARVARGAQEFATLIAGKSLHTAHEIDELATPNFETLLRQGGIEF